MTKSVETMLLMGVALVMAGCGKSASTATQMSIMKAGDAAADALRDAVRDAPGRDAADGGGYALCCAVPRVLTGLEQYDPNYETPYHNVLVNGTPQQQADATCDLLSAWPGPTRPGANATQAQIDAYLAEFKAGPDIAITMPCGQPTDANTSYGQWQCGGDAGQSAGCMNDGWSCGEGSKCWFDPGGTNGYGCTGTVVKCYYPWNGSYPPPSG